MAWGMAGLAALVTVLATTAHAQRAQPEATVTFLLSGGAQQVGCTATFRFDWGDGSAPLSGIDRQRALHHVYRVGSWHASLKESYSHLSTKCSFTAPGNKHFGTMITHLVFMCSSATCSLSGGLPPAYTGPIAVQTAPKGVLPRVHGGVIAPLLAGTIPYWEPTTGLNRFWGIPTLDPLEQCNIQACPWELGHNQVAPQDQARPQPKAPHLLTAVYFTSVAGGNLPPWGDNAITNSKLRAWHTPDGVHIGMTLAEAKQRSPTRNRSCIVQYGTRETCSYRTQPYSFRFNGAERRQVFNIFFTADRRKPLVFTIGASIEGDEGHCTVESGLPESGSLVTNATCWGPLVSATFEATNGGRFGELQSVDGRPKLALDADGNNLAEVPLPSAVVTARRVSASASAFDVLQCDQCFPGRGATAPAWPAGAFEEWDISGSWHFSTGPNAVPLLRFTAHFVGLPDFEITFPATNHEFG